MIETPDGYFQARFARGRTPRVSAFANLASTAFGMGMALAACTAGVAVGPTGAGGSTGGRTSNGGRAGSDGVAGSPQSGGGGTGASGGGTGGRAVVGTGGQTGSGGGAVASGGSGIVDAGAGVDVSTGSTGGAVAPSADAAGENPDFCRSTLPGSLPAFPGAEGFGAHAKGGRGGDVYHVTNLNSSGPGSLAYGIENVPATGRTIVFDVSGYAEISGYLRLTKPRVTIAGQTAPGDGFGVKGGTFLLSAGDAVIRHIRFRNGRSADSVNLDSQAINVIWDHCDMMFGPDENMSSYENPSQNMTYQYSINAWGLDDHACGGLWDQGRATAHHSLWGHQKTRNPKVRAVLLDWINNVTFDWDIGFIMGDSDAEIRWQANVRGSTFISSYAKTDALEKARLTAAGKPNFFLYVEDSILDGNANGVLDTTKADFAIASGDYGKLSAPVPLTANHQAASASNPVVGIPVTQDNALTAYKKVVSAAGPLRLDVRSVKPLRDEVDTQMIEDLVTQKKRRLANMQIAANGLTNSGFGTLASLPAPVDTDRDGMPDYWEKAVGLNPAAADNNGMIPNCVFAYVPANSGYTWLEDYLQFKAIPHGVVARRTAATQETGGTYLDVDMTRFTSGLKAGATFVVSAAVNGGVTVLPDGKTARFIPALNHVGRAGFTFAGTDSDQSKIAFDVGVLVAEATP